jgi:phenylpyruvate tautomerase PptA (4-oxalocrotonate tautomerase family)
METAWGLSACFPAGEAPRTANITDAVVKSPDVKNEDVRIILQETAKDDSGAAGVPVVDKKA